MVHFSEMVRTHGFVGEVIRVSENHDEKKYAFTLVGKGYEEYLRCSREQLPAVGQVVDVECEVQTFKGETRTGSILRIDVIDSAGVVGASVAGASEGRPAVFGTKKAA